MNVQIEYYGMPGQGRNVTEAKKDAGRKIEQAMSGSYQPVMLESRGTIVILWRDPHGWRFNTIVENGKPREAGFQCYSSGRDDYYAEYASALLHLAQMTWDGAELIPPCLGDLPAMFSRKDCDGRRLLSEFAHWRGFQLAYRHAKENGIGEGDCDWHRWACEHTTQFAA